MQNQVFIGNLAFAATQQDLISLFTECGGIAEVKIPVEHRTGRARGFAFVTFETQEGAQKALQFDGRDLKGRPIRVHFAHEKKAGGERSGGGGGRGGFGGGGGGKRRGGRDFSSGGGYNSKSSEY